MDKIIVKANTDMERVMDWAEKLEGMAIVLPFSEAEIEFVEELTLLKFKETKYPFVQFEMLIHSNEGDPFHRLVSWTSNLEDGTVAEVSIAGDGLQKAQLAMMIAQNEIIQKSVTKFKALMLFSVYYREEVERTKTVRRTVTTHSKSGKRKGSHRKPLTIRTYTVSNEMLSELPPPKRERKGYRSSFSVRGHYRKLKNGKFTWVRPYVKKGIAETKADNEYIL